MAQSRRNSDEEFVLDELNKKNASKQARNKRLLASTSTTTSKTHAKDKAKTEAICGEAQASGCDADVKASASMASSSFVSVSQQLPQRLCMVCRQYFRQDQLLRLTVEYSSGRIVFNQARRGKERICGRSAYICLALSCLEGALKGTRLKLALQGRKLKGAPERRSVAWPLESQLIHTLRSKCTEYSESCQNTLRKEGC